MTGEPTVPVLERIRKLAEQQDALDKRNAIDDRITDAFQRVAHAGVVLSLVEYVRANEAYTAACNLVFERRADPVSLAAPLVRLEGAREKLGLQHIPMTGRDDDA